MKVTTKLWMGLGMLVLLSPLGLLVPAHFKAGAAWGEWGGEEVKALVGYIPAGFERLSAIWNAPFPDYAFKGWEEKGLPQLSFAYILSAVIGIAATVTAVWIFGKLLVKKE